MLKVTYTNVTMTELNPDHPDDGDKSFRLLQYIDAGDGQPAPWFELLVAAWLPCEGGDAESGPRVTWERSDWKQVAAGYQHAGASTIEQMVEVYYCDCDKVTCTVCHPDRYIGF